MTPTIGRKRELKWLPVETIIKNELNPRDEESFRPEELQDLRRSIRDHGILDPVMVTPYDDLYKIIEGERRFTSAKLEGFKEIPAYVVPRMSDHDEVVVMFNIHTQRRGWRFEEQLLAIERLISENGHMTHEELAQELGMNLRTFEDRLSLLQMGPSVRKAIANDEIAPYVALRAGQTAKTLDQRRPEMVQRLGGEQVVTQKLVAKGKRRGKGMTRELEQIKSEARDVDITPDAVLETYIRETDTGLNEARRKAATLVERRAVEDLAKRVTTLDRELKSFRVDLAQAPNLRELRRALAGLAETASDLEFRVSNAMRAAGVSS